jgi:uncharacterized SAM-binding protein YcdF (DUF218 family)
MGAMVRRLTVAAVLLAGAVALVWGGRHAALIQAGRLLVAEDPLAPARVLVVSLASPARATLEAVRLYHEGISQTIVLPTWESDPILGALRGLGLQQLSANELALAILERSGIPTDAVQVLPGAVDGTTAEIAAVAAFARERQPARLLFVVARSHSARVRWFLRRELPTATHLIVRSPSTDAFRPESWWHSRDESRELVTEYLRWANMLILRDPWRRSAVIRQ